MNKIKIIISGVVALLIAAFIATGVVLFIYVKLLWPLILALALCFIMEVFFAIHIINSRRSWYAKTCWIMVIIILPVIGLIAFLIMGVNPLRRRKRKVYLESQQTFIQYEDFRNSVELMADEEKSNLNWIFKYGLNNMYKPVYNNNHIELIQDNTQLFEKSIELVRSAKTYINIQSYIFNYNGFWSKLFFNELIKKANEGVKVRLIYDWLGIQKRVSKKIFKELEKYGIEVACFNPSNFNAIKGATNYRLHSKFVIVDNKTALYGGSNFADEYLSMARDNCHWNDLNYLITGPVVNTMNVTFINYWTAFSKKANAKYSDQNIKNDASMILKKQKFESSDTLAQLLVFEPDFNEFALENVLINAFYNAKKSIKILTPYFCPPNKIVEALKYCHNKGIEVEIIAHNKNQKYVQMMNRENYKKLTDVGIKVYEYDGYLHSKGMIIDGKYVMTGSCNIDYRSIYLDFESELVIRDEQIVKDLTTYYENARKNSTLQTSKMLEKKLTLWSRFLLKILNFGKSLA